MAKGSSSSNWRRRQDSDEFVKRGGKVLILDQIQKYPEWRDLALFFFVVLLDCQSFASSSRAWCAEADRSPKPPKRTGSFARPHIASSGCSPDSDSNAVRTTWVI